MISATASVAWMLHTRVCSMPPWCLTSPHDEPPTTTCAMHDSKQFEGENSGLAFAELRWRSCLRKLKAEVGALHSQHRAALARAVGRLVALVQRAALLKRNGSGGQKVREGRARRDGTMQRAQSSVRTDTRARAGGA